MPFEVYELQKPKARYGASLRIKRKKSSEMPGVMLGLKSEVIQEAGWTEDWPTHVELLIGTGEDNGKIRLVPAARGAYVKRIGGGRGNIIMRGAALDLGYVEPLGREERDKTSAVACILDSGGIEIELPDWTLDKSEQKPKDEELPNPMTSRSHVEGKMIASHPRMPSPGPATKPNGRSRKIVEKLGVLLDASIDPPVILSHNGERLELTKKQAAILAPLVLGLGGLILTSDLITASSKAGCALSASQIADEADELSPCLADLALKLAHTPKMGYTLRKE